MPVVQKNLQLNEFPRGFHIITSRVEEAIPEIREVVTGLLHVFIQHTSASLSINENADPDVRRDMESFYNQNIPENSPYFIHTLEGPDDMPAHIKSSILGSSVTIPVKNGRLALGTWQGIYLGEHRDRGRPRKLILTLWF